MVFSRTPPPPKFRFHRKFLDKFDKFGTHVFILFFKKSILLPVNVCKIAG